VAASRCAASAARLLGEGPALNGQQGARAGQQSRPDRRRPARLLLEVLDLLLVRVLGQRDRSAKASAAPCSIASAIAPGRIRHPERAQRRGDHVGPLHRAAGRRAAAAARRPAPWSARIGRLGGVQHRPGQRSAACGATPGTSSTHHGSAVTRSSASRPAPARSARPWPPARPPREQAGQPAPLVHCALTLCSSRDPISEIRGRHVVQAHPDRLRSSRSSAASAPRTAPRYALLRSRVTPGGPAPGQRHLTGATPSPLRGRGHASAIRRAARQVRFRRSHRTGRGPPRVRGIPVRYYRSARPPERRQGQQPIPSASAPERPPAPLRAAAASTPSAPTRSAPGPGTGPLQEAGRRHCSQSSWTPPHISPCRATAESRAESVSLDRGVIVVRVPAARRPRSRCPAGSARASGRPADARARGVEPPLCVVPRPPSVAITISARMPRPAARAGSRTRRRSTRRRVHQRAPGVEKGLEAGRPRPTRQCPGPRSSCPDPGGHAQSVRQMSLLHSCECSGWGRARCGPLTFRLVHKAAHRPFGGTSRPPSTRLVTRE